MIIRQNHKRDKILWKFGFSWWQRQKLKLWFHFMPHKTICLFKEHSWGDLYPIIVDGPLHLPPKEREWQMIALYNKCNRCAKTINFPFDEEEAKEYIQKEILNAEEEWNDFEVRKALENLSFAAVLFEKDE